MHFRKEGGSRNSLEMRMSGMTGMSLHISPSLRNYSANVGIWRGSIPIYSSMLWVTLARDSTSFRYGGDTGFHDAHISMLVKVKVPNDCMRPASMMYTMK